MSKNLKKKVRIGIFLLIGITLFYTINYLSNWFSYSGELPYYQRTCQKKDSILTIGIIGDSWVSSGRKMDSLLQKKLLDKGIISRVVSSGNPGAKSKLIYQNLFYDNNKLNSSKFIIEECPEYCVVIAGVNDAASQVGSGFYSYHMIMIIKTLLHYNTKPVIVELPEFGIEEATNEMNFIKKNRNILYSKITNSGELDNIKTYRKNFQKQLAEQNLLDSIIFIGFDSVCADYSKCPDLYENTSHLSKKGSEELTDNISSQLETIIKQKKKVLN